ncbi:hypothetical protein HTT03_13815 [Sulfitobacter sp. S0837]|uniref:hypothetical protein n=1 Tax=Sulfitobacter maritimus TaxID=2741719 RepID=UPI00158259D3|nr:hypothetical protein [Sulfitobacter maritimus]NUH66361.1 hypothetical protein [Sulfitobacter maritimus]
MMTSQTLIAIIGMAGSVTAFYLAWRGHKRSYKATEPDNERLRRFVQTAPSYRLKGLISDDDFKAALSDHPTLGSHDPGTVYERLRMMYVSELHQKSWYLSERAVDYRIATRMLNAGWNETDVASAIHACSPIVKDRQGGLQGYAAQTAKNARAELKRKEPNFRQRLPPHNIP